MGTRNELFEGVKLGLPLFLLGSFLGLGSTWAKTTSKNSDPAIEPGTELFLDIGGGTALPLSLGFELQLELPHRVQLGIHVGWMPPGYVDLVNGIVVGVGGYEEDTAELISAAVSNALILRPRIGWRPIPKAGLEIYGGYTYAGFGGGLSPAELIEIYGGQSLEFAGETEVPLTSEMHGFEVGAQYRFVIREHLVLRLQLGYFQVLGSKSSIDLSAPRPGRQAIIDAVEDELDDYLDATYKTWVKSPVIGVHLSYRFDLRRKSANP